MNSLLEEIHKIAKKCGDKKINLMEVCGTHTMAIARSGIKSILPENIHLLSGPGCPVCVTPQDVIDYAIGLAQHKEMIITTFGDMVRVPGTESSLESFNPRIIYSPLDVLDIAQENPEKDVVFIGVGFETTSPTVAATIIKAEQSGIKNFFILPAFKLIPPALRYIANSSDINVQGFILPGHVSVIIGARPYQFLAREFNLPGCITGFEPIDILGGILNLINQIANGRAEIAIEYTRVVEPAGNTYAQAVLNKVFTPESASWRGIGAIPKSGLGLKRAYKKFDVRKKYALDIPASKEPRGCICGKVLLGLKRPFDCALFGDSCTPSHPIGPCMVSSEGACAAYYRYEVFH